MVLVEHHSHGYAPFDRGGERVAEDRTRGGLQAEVVDRDLQRLLRAVYEGRDSLRDRDVGLRPVRQEIEVER
jgi:hypothetical protein